MKRYPILALVLAALLLTGCAGQNTTTTTPNVPEPPQVTVLRLDQALADSANIAANTFNILWQAGKISPGTATDVKAYLVATVSASQAIADEAKSTDTWPVMRVKIAGIAATVTASTVVDDPQLKANILALQAVITQILEVK
jgi:PBP1b-binding outer membrane lipoprotein LpoB